MKKIFTTIIVLNLMLWACSPYKNIQQMKSFSELKYNYETKYQDLSNEIKLAYIDQGSGKETIIFIHGLGSYLPAWNKTIEGLKDQYRCIAIDLPGYGKSSKNPHSGLMSFYAKTVLEFLDSMGIENPILTGHSMGGQISMVAALQYPERVKKLILFAPAGFEKFTAGQKEWFRKVFSFQLVKTTPADAIQTNLAVNFYQVPADAEFMITDRMAMRTADEFDHYCLAVINSVNGMVNEPVVDKLQNITQPALIIFGENDNLIPNRYLNPGFTKDIAESGAKKIKNSELKIVEKAGHFIMFEKPEECNQAIINFLK